MVARHRERMDGAMTGHWVDTGNETWSLRGSDDVSLGGVLYDQNIEGVWGYRSATLDAEGFAVEEASHESLYWAMRWVEGRTGQTPRSAAA